MADHREEDSPPREISFLQQQQLLFRRAITHFTNPDLYLYTGQTRDQIPDDVLNVRVDPSVRVIEWDTFAGCGQMRSIELPHGLVRIMGRAFLDCYALKDPQIPPTVKEIGDMAFSSCLAMNSLDLPEGLERIGRAAFPSCSFRNVKIPRSMTEVGDKVFSCCTDMISIEIPHGVTAIHSEAFFQCLELRNVAIPDTVNVIGENAFECCFKLQDKFPEEDSLVEALKTRFDDLPLHKICYYQAHQSTEETLQELSEAMMDMDALETVGGGVPCRVQQDAFGLTPLHILAMSKKQQGNMELYQFLVETYPEDLTVYDTWGYLPIYYACLSDAPLEIAQYLLDTHKRLSPENAVEEIPWHAIVDSFSIMFVSAAVLKCVIHWTIVDRLELLEYAPWREAIIQSIDLIPDGGRKTWKEKDKQVNAVYDLVNLCELKELTSILELVAWKSKVDQTTNTTSQGDVDGKNQHQHQQHVELPVVLEVAATATADSDSNSAAEQQEQEDEKNNDAKEVMVDPSKRLSSSTHTTHTTTRSSMETTASSTADRYSILTTERESIVDRSSIISKTVVEEEEKSSTDGAVGAVGGGHAQDDDDDDDDDDEEVVETDDPEALAMRNNCRINSGAELIISNVMPFCRCPVQLQAWDSSSQGAE
ncbi:unnamed protein product [Cylindrotheca closterium]|uniref:Uncharacterized protein n=1 Tax=Cylindrotheca closterium TaxID=2856 RepID=A0AAD2FR14_9STRA|nr:unnamed protein product [Cylindrotheca closterium]